jgi:hypothetical protein
LWLWPRERKSVRERYNFEGRGDVIKPSARGGLTRSIILLQRTRGVDRLSSRGRGWSNKVYYLVTEDQGHRQA